MSRLLGLDAARAGCVRRQRWGVWIDCEGDLAGRPQFVAAGHLGDEGGLPDQFEFKLKRGDVVLHGDIPGPELIGLVARRRGIAHLPSKDRSEEHTSELQSRQYLVCRL